MRAFLFVGLIIIAFLFIASSSMAGVDLTPGSPYVESQPAIVMQESAPAQVVQGVSITAPLPVQPTQVVQPAQAAVVPVTGTTACANPYTVLAGDTVSLIGRRCGFTTEQIQAANPQIANINLIFPGQQIALPGAVVNQPVTNTNPATTTLPLPVTGNVNVLRMGSGLQVTGLNFPANTLVNIGIGQLNQGYSILASATTDAAGMVVTNINLPANADPSVQWVVVVSTTTVPVIQDTSAPFYLQ